MWFFSSLWCGWWWGRVSGPQNNREAWGTLSALPICYLGTSPLLGISRVERECPLGRGPAPIPHLRPLGFSLLAQRALPCSLFAIFICLTPGSAEQLEGGWPRIAPFIFPLLSILGTKRGFLRRGAGQLILRQSPNFKELTDGGGDNWFPTLMRKTQDSKGKLICGTPVQQTRPSSGSSFGWGGVSRIFYLSLSLSISSLIFLSIH